MPLATNNRPKLRGSKPPHRSNVSCDLNDARSKTDAANAVLNDKRMIAATSDERRRSAVSALRRVENESKEIESRLALQNLEMTDADAKIRDLHTSINDITDRIASASDEIASENVEITAAITGLATLVKCPTA